LLKKADLDADDVKSYRPIANLTSKLLERLVAQQLVEYLTDSGLLPDLQSTYSTPLDGNRCSEGPIADILLALDSGNLAVLILLDLSASFDSVNQSTLLHRLKHPTDLAVP